MAENKFGWRRETLSAPPSEPSKDMSGDKSKVAPATAQPAAKPEKAPAEVAPASKS